MKVYWVFLFGLAAAIALWFIPAACEFSTGGGDDDDNDISPPGDDDDNDVTDDDTGDDDVIDDDDDDDATPDDDVTDDDTGTEDFALSFNGQGDYVVLGQGDWINGNYTLEAWVKAAPSVNLAHVISSTEDDPWRFNFLLYLGGSDNPGTVSGGHWDGSVDWLNGTTNIYNDYDWHHIAIVFNNSTLEAAVYLDGQLEASKYFYTSPGQGGDQVVAAGANAAENKSYYRGFMDELRISNAVRYTGPSFIPSRYNLTDQYTVGLWHFNEGDGLLVHDASGNHEAGDIYGATWVEVEE